MVADARAIVLPEDSGSINILQRNFSRFRSSLRCIILQVCESRFFPFLPLVIMELPQPLVESIP